MKTFIKNLAAKMGYKVQNTKYMLKPFLEGDHVMGLEFDHVLSKYLLGLPDPSSLTFIQVGAFDGVECDPLRKYLLRYNWKGVMLEPQPIPFSKLSRQYEGRLELNILNAAIARTNGKANLFILEGDNLPEWTKGMASFEKSNILKHAYLIPDLEKHIKQIEIDTISFEEIFKRNNLKKVDLLQVDTEGFDAEVIRMFPFHLLKPAVIHFECKHIKKDDLENLLADLIQKGYEVAYDRGEDMMAVLPEQVK